MSWLTAVMSVLPKVTELAVKLFSTKKAPKRIEDEPTYAEAAKAAADEAARKKFESPTPTE